MVNLLHTLSVSTFKESADMAAGADLRHCADTLRVLSETKLPEVVSFDDLKQYIAASQTAVFDLSKIAAEAQAALERARKQLERLAALVETPPPPKVVKTQPPQNNPDTRISTPGQQPGTPAGAGIREVSRNVFVVEMANMPPNARFIWNFGDGSPQYQTNSSQVQQRLYGTNRRNFRFGGQEMANDRHDLRRRRPNRGQRIAHGLSRAIDRLADTETAAIIIQWNRLKMMWGYFTTR